MKKKPKKPRPRRTLRGTVRNALRKLWLQSNERAWAIKRDKYTCQCGCGRKQSKAKGKEFNVQVHHINGIDWEGIIDIIIDRILVDPDYLKTLGKECHKKQHNSGAVLK